MIGRRPVADTALGEGVARVLDVLLVDRIVAGCCAVVAVMRKLQVDTVTVLP